MPLPRTEARPRDVDLRPRLRAQLDAVVRLSRGPRYLTPPADAVRATMELVAEVLDVDRASTWLLDEDATKLRCVDLFERPAGVHSVGESLLAADYPAYFEAVLHQRAVDASDARTDPRTVEFAESYLRPLGIFSMLDAAIRREGATLGVVCLEQTGERRHWSLDEVSFVGQVADHVGRILLEDERRRAERALRDSERNYREIFNATSDALLVHDHDGRILDANDQACTLFGLAREAILGRTIAALSPDESPHGPAEAADRWRRAAVEGVQTFEWRLRRGRGDPLWVEVSLRAAVIAGEPRVIASLRDITGRKAQQEEQRRLAAQLHQAKRMEAIGRLAGGVAHDFNNFLTAIMGGLELAELELPTGSAARKPLREVLATSETAAAVTRQLLAFARHEPLELQAVETGALVEQLLPTLRRLIGDDVTLALSTEPELWTVTADPSQLEQVVLNLVVNARDAMPMGGEIEVSAQNRLLAPEGLPRRPGARPGEFVRLRIRDTGTGIPARLLDRIFDPFFTTKPVGRGTGLGLSTLLGIVERASGFVDVASTEGSGTVFDVYLPRAASPARPRPCPPRRSDELPRGDETILLVDDDDMVRRMVGRLLRRLGYQVIAAGHAAEALDALAQPPAPVALLLTDVGLPDVSGPELAEAVAARHPAIRILLSSGYTEESLPSAGRSKLAGPLLRKPYSLQELAHAVRGALALPHPPASGASR